MSLTITVPPEIETRLRMYAASVGKPLEEVGQIALFRFVQNPDATPSSWVLTAEAEEQQRRASDEYYRIVREEAANATP